MKEKILSALKNKFKNLGFGERAFDGVADYLAQTVTEETEIDNALSGVEPLLKAFQGDIDKRVNTYKSELEKLKSKGNPNQERGADDPGEPENDKTHPEIKSLMNMVSQLTGAVQGLVEKDKHNTLQQKWNEAVKEKGIKNQKLIEKWMPQKEEDFDTALSDLESFHKDFAVEDANGRSPGKPAGSGGVPAGSKKGEALLDKWVESTKPLGANIQKNEN